MNISLVSRLLKNPSGAWAVFWALTNNLFSISMPIAFKFWTLTQCPNKYLCIYPPIVCFFTVVHWRESEIDLGTMICWMTLSWSTLGFIVKTAQICLSHVKFIVTVNPFLCWVTPPTKHSVRDGSKFLMQLVLFMLSSFSLGIKNEFNKLIIF